MNGAAVAGIILGVVLTALMSGVAFYLRTISVNVAGLDSKLDSALTRITVVEVQQGQMHTHESRINTLGQTLAVLASEVENHQGWHRESTLLSRERVARDRERE